MMNHSKLQPAHHSRLFTLLLAGLALFGSGAAVAGADGPDWWSVHGVTADDVLNMRAKANPKAGKVGEIPRGPTA